MEIDYSNPSPGDTKEAARELALNGGKPPGRERGPNGQFAKKETTQEHRDAVDAKWFEEHREELKSNTLPDMAQEQEQAPEAEAKADAPEQASESKAENVDKDALAAAMLDARRLKIPAKALDAMTPSEIVQAGQDWKAQIAESGKLSQKFGELEKQFEAMKAEKGAASAKTDQPAVDLDALVQPLVADYDESTRKTLGGLAKFSIEQAKAAAKEIVQAEIAELLKSAKAADTEQRARFETRESVFGELEGKVPQLGKASVKTAVLKRAESFSQLPEFKDDYAGALRLAIRAECASFEPAAQASESTRSKRNGVASTNSQAPRPRQVSSLDEADNAWFAKNRIRAS